jgi:hypothetical protein
MRNSAVGLLVLLLTTVAPARGQKIPLSAEQVARLARVENPAEVVTKDLPGYCFDPLDTRRGEQAIADSAHRRDANADAGPIIRHMRQNPCEADTNATARVVAHGPVPTRREPVHSQPATQSTTVSDSSLQPLPDTRPSRGSDTEASPRLVTPDNRCAVNQPPPNARDLQIPHYTAVIYVFLQTQGPLEEAESERLAIAMPKEEFRKCFEAFRDLARSRNMRLIVTATADHRSWDQPEIRYRGHKLQVVGYKSPDENKVFPGAEVPLY